MSEVTEKLTKKQRKALEFRNKTKTKNSNDSESKTNEEEHDDKKRKRDDEEESTKEKVEVGEDGEVLKKKRKTRRGKKGKGSGGSHGPRFLLFVGNLPYDITETELLSHFSASKPDRIRIRKEKGIAFLEFDGEGGDIQHKMEVALRMHRSTLRSRKINVELTVGGGGNSSNRLKKIEEKNNKLDDERKETIRKKKQEEEEKKKKTKAVDLKNVHPARAKLMK